MFFFQSKPSLTRKTFSTTEYNFALIEDGAELPREKRDQRVELNL